MYTDTSRRQLLRGGHRGKHASIRPPWSLQQDEFLVACTACGDCIKHCPEHILVTGSDNYPVVDFRLGECTFCGGCVDHCSANALLRYVDNSVRDPWNVKAVISDSCLASQRTTCITCVEVCQRDALTFAFGSTGTSKPNLDPGLCNGCGACYVPCPANAISMEEF